MRGSRAPSWVLGLYLDGVRFHAHRLLYVSDLVTVLVRFVSRLVATTWAPATTAWDESRTVPSIVPVTSARRCVQHTLQSAAAIRWLRATVTASLYENCLWETITKNERKSKTCAGGKLVFPDDSVRCSPCGWWGTLPVVVLRKEGAWWARQNSNL